MVDALEIAYRLLFIGVIALGIFIIGIIIGSLFIPTED
jgi:hypothetical protein